MSKILRETMTIFGASAGANQIEQFGSLAAGSPNYLTPGSAAIPTIQALSAWLEGWYGGIVGSDLPCIQDMNAVCYLYAYQLAYIFQAGVPEWDAGTTYFTGSYVQSAGVLYTSLQDNNLNNAVSVTAYWSSPLQPLLSVFTTSGTFVAPAGVTSVDVIADFPSQANDTNYQSAAANCMSLIDPQGTIWSWGSGGSLGLLGTGGLNDSSSPVLIAGSSIQYRQIFLGSNTNAAVDKFGTVWTWGLATAGATGNGAQSGAFSSPVAVLGSTKFSKIMNGSLQNGSTIAIDASGNLWGWGANPTGNLGVGDVAARSSPTLVLGGHNFSSAEVGENGVIGYDTAGNGWAWGGNISGELGVGDVVSRSSPVAILGSHLWKSMRMLLQNNISALGLDTAGKLWGWGDNTKGTLGNGNNISVSSPVAVAGSIVFTTLAKGRLASAPHIGGVDNTGKLWMWGANANGELGDGTVVAKSSPVAVLGNTSYSQVFVNNGLSSAGTSYGLDTAGNLWAWGSNANGVLGTAQNPGSVLAVSSPVQVVGGNVWKYMWLIGTSNNPTAYALDQYGQLWGWGYNLNGQVGNGTQLDQSSPVMVTGPAHPMIVNPPPNTFRITVVPGTSYAVNLAWACTFGGTIVGYLAKSITVKYVG
jgi:alpha-tubulin suppressor-like RCC1 family protein